MSKEVYSIVCYEAVKGKGQACWSGEEEYIRNSLADARSFIDERLSSLGAQTEDNRIYDESGNPTSQYVVTYSISCKKKKTESERR